MQLNKNLHIANARGLTKAPVLPYLAAHAIKAPPNHAFFSARRLPGH